MKVLLTGATGFLGRHTLPVMQRLYGCDNVIGVNSKDYDLEDRRAVERMFSDLRPEVVVHFAAYSGGIGANRHFPADFYYRNTVLTAHVFDAAAKAKVKKLVYPMGGCSYPAKAISPIDEDQLWNGYPQEESAGYSTSKMMGTVAARSYRSQYGLDATVIIPGNMYGEYDNFNREASHVVPAMIRRYYEAQQDGQNKIVMWGTGKPQRDFVYAADIAATIPFFIDHFNEAGPVNISSGTATSIFNLATIIAELVEFKGEITWDTNKPDGQMVKIFSADKLNSLGLSCPTTLRAGLERTIRWFARNYAEQSDGLRL